MKVSDLVSFRRDLFFEGAVQIGWLTGNRERAELAARNFMFNGPEFQAIQPQDIDEDGLSERLVDTCGFVNQLLNKITPDSVPETPHQFVLAIAGYGTGKSHLGLTLSLLLTEQTDSPIRRVILDNLKAASTELGASIESQLNTYNKPFLVVCLDGMQDFNLGAEFNRQLLRALRSANLNMTAVELLSPRFTIASDFVEKNFARNSKRFLTECKAPDQPQILARLAERNEETFKAVNGLFKDFTGTSIPLAGQESPQDLISCVCEQYCASQGQFAGLVVLFDEFGRYLEFASEKNSNAGPSALQQIHQGIQDNPGTSLFLGLIQYELKAYLNKIALTGDVQLGKYIGRYDSADKYFLSSNLETLLAHLITKENTCAIDEYIDTQIGVAYWRELYGLMSQTLPTVESCWVWNNFDHFLRVIVKGCWPLDPLTVWFLSRQQDIVQNRSAISFVAAELDLVANMTLEPHNQPFSVRATDLCLGPMFEEILAAEHVQHGSIAESFAAIREDLKDRLTREHLKILASVVVSQKIRTQPVQQKTFDRLIAALSGLSLDAVGEGLKDLINNFCVLEWNDELRRYELIVGAVTRSQFHSFLNRKLHDSADNNAVLQIFQQYGQSWGELLDIDPVFAPQKLISTSEWKFKVSCASKLNMKHTLSECLKSWKNADTTDVPRGHLIYCLVLQSDDLAKVREDFRTCLETECLSLGVSKAPIIGVITYDSDGSIRDALARLQLLRTGLSNEDKEKFSKFLEEERNRQTQKLQNAIKESVKERDYIFCKKDLVETKDRLSKVCYAVFDKIYPEIIPFKFDGFGTAKGNAAKDCAHIVRALAVSEVTKNWSTGLMPQTQNRFRTLFDDTWLALTEKYELAKYPKHSGLHKLMEKIDTLLSTSENVTLGNIYHMLIQPPYGFNNASAGLVIGMLLGRRTPSLSLRYEGTPVQRETWVGNYAFEDKKQFFSVTALSKTGVRVITGDTKAQWRTLLDNWGAEKNPFKSQALKEEADKLRAEIGMPEDFEAACSLLLNQMDEVSDRLERFFRKSDELRSFQDECEHSKDTSKWLKLAQVASRYLNELDSDKKYEWPSKAKNEIKFFQECVKERLLEVFPKWLAEQRCSNAMGIGAFKNNLDLVGKTLISLELKEFALLTEKHYQRVNQDIEIHQKHKTLIPEATEFLALSTPDDTTLHRQLEDNVRHGQKIVELLKEYNEELRGDQATSELQSQVLAQIENIKTTYKRQKERISNLTDRELNSPEAVAAALRELTILQQIFSGREDDCEYLKSIHQELTAYHEDVSQYQSLNVSEEQFEQIISEQQDARRREFEEKGIDASWDIETVYTGFRDYGLAAFRERSERWLTNNVPVENVSRPISAKQLQKAIAALEDPPIWFFHEHRDNLLGALHDLRARLHQLQEKEWDRWFDENVPNEDDISSLSESKCRQVLERIRSVPNGLPVERRENLELRKRQIDKRLDSLNYEDLLERCKQLSEAQLRQLLADLQIRLKV